MSVLVHLDLLAWIGGDDFAVLSLNAGVLKVEQYIKNVEVKLSRL